VHHALISGLTSLARCGVGTAVWLWCSAASAQSDKPFAAPTATAASAPSSAASLAQVTLSLLLVLAAVFAAAWVVRRMRGFGKFGAPAITVIADVGLGPKERAVLVQVGSQQLLLGVAPGRVSTLHVLAEPITAPSPSSVAQPGAAFESPAVPDFKTILKRSLGLKQ
jgi:flagellar protein FliO/FliZ